MEGQTHTKKVSSAAKRSPGRHIFRAPHLCIGIRTWRERLKDCDLDPNAISELSETELRHLVAPGVFSRKQELAEPDFDKIRFEVAERGVRLKTLYIDYRQGVPEGCRAMSRTTFYRIVAQMADKKVSPICAGANIMGFCELEAQQNFCTKRGHAVVQIKLHQVPKERVLQRRNDPLAGSPEPLALTGAICTGRLGGRAHGAA